MSTQRAPHLISYRLPAPHLIIPYGCGEDTAQADKQHLRGQVHHCLRGFFMASPVPGPYCSRFRGEGLGVRLPGFR